MRSLPCPCIWQLNLDEVDDDPALLGTAESDRAARFVRPDDARRYVQAHCALRRILGDAVGVAPDRLEFLSTVAGKPELSPPSTLDFSLSHSGPRALIAISDKRRVGVDIEVRRDMDDLVGVARSVMSVSELEAFERTGPELMRDAFFDLWTRKEALLKAAGYGFLQDPRTVDIDVREETTSIEFAAKVWTIIRLSAGGDAAAAIAIEDEAANDRISRELVNYRLPDPSSLKGPLPATVLDRVR
jgi:4'-phosphopantetheinyl transferase